MTSPSSSLQAVPDCSLTPDISGVRGDLVGFTNTTRARVTYFLDTEGRIDFSMLSHAFQEDPKGIEAYFEASEHREKVLFPFLDFLKSSYFARNQKIPDDILNIFQEYDHIRDGVIDYVNRKNDEVMALTHAEQDDTISFHLLLLEREDFNMRIDIEANHFAQIETLFATISPRIYGQLGIIRAWTSAPLPARLSREINHFITLSETINKLALIYAANVEDIRFSLRLGEIIRRHIGVLILNLRLVSTPVTQDFIKKLQFLSGKVQCNFAHGTPINGSSVKEVESQIERINQDLDDGFCLQEIADFGGNADEYYSSMMVHQGNAAIAGLIGLQQIEKLEGTIKDREAKKRPHLRTLYDMYNSRADTNFSTGEQVLEHFITKDIAHEHQIEAVYYIILFDTTVSNTTLVQLVDFFYPGRENSSTSSTRNTPQTNNFFYEEFTIKIIAELIRRLHTTSNKEVYLPLIDWVCHSLVHKDISHSILSYSKVYLALALYYIECPQGKIRAKEAFIHYQNLTGRNAVANQELELTQDERHFYMCLGKIDEQERYGEESRHSVDAMIKAGKLILTRVASRYRLEAMIKVQKMISEIIVTMDTGDQFYSQEFFNQKLGELISKNIFYNLCTITIIGDCANCSSRERRNVCSSSGNYPGSGTISCPMMPPRRGFAHKKIDIDENVSIVCTYPKGSQKIFEQIFDENQEKMREYFLHIFATNNKNKYLQDANEHLQKLAFYDTETLLPNKNNLKEVLRSKQRIIVLIKIVGHDTIVARSGEKAWSDIIKQTAEYIESHTPRSDQVYRYGGTTLCLTYDPRALPNIQSLGKSELHNRVYDMTEDMLQAFYDHTGHKIQCHVGISLDYTSPDQLQHALNALTKSRHKRAETIHIFHPADKERMIEMNTNEQLLLRALDPTCEQVKFTPYYQRIFDSENPTFQKYEALARIECLEEDGTKRTVYPDKFIDIAAEKRYLSKITLTMLPQILADMKTYPELRVSINIHEQDWSNRNNELIKRLVAIHASQEIDPGRITLEMLETASFNREGDIQKIRMLRGLGYKFSLDDYGTGTGDANKLIAVGPDNVKIDATIIKKLTDQPRPNDTQETVDDIIRQRNAAISHIRGLVSMARDGGYTITAEYIETEEVYRTVKELGVRWFQGYFFGKALPIREVMQPV